MARDTRARRQRSADRILPDGCPEWIVHAGDAFERKIDGRWVRQPRSFLAGTLTRSVAAAERLRVIDLALAAGYFDEAHMLKDFRSLAGRKPRSRPETDGELARYFTRPNRLRTLLEQRD